MAAADSATRTDPSVEPTTGPAPRRTRRSAGAKAADGKQATPRERAAAPSGKAGKAGRSAPRSGAAEVAGGLGADEPADLDGADLELEGAPDVVDLEDGDVVADVLDPALETLDPEIEGVPEADGDAADDDEDEAEDEAEVETGPVVRAGLSRAPSSTPHKSGDFVWDEEESEALRQARKDAELTASADSVRAYLKQIGKVALLNAEEEVELAKRIEAGLYAAERLRRTLESGE